MFRFAIARWRLWRTYNDISACVAVIAERMTLSFLFPHNTIYERVLAEQ